MEAEAVNMKSKSAPAAAGLGSTEAVSARLLRWGGGGGDGGGVRVSGGGGSGGLCRLCLWLARCCLAGGAQMGQCCSQRLAVLRCRLDEWLPLARSRGCGCAPPGTAPTPHSPGLLQVTSGAGLRLGGGAREVCLARIEAGAGQRSTVDPTRRRDVDGRARKVELLRRAQTPPRPPHGPARREWRARAARKGRPGPHCVADGAW